MDFDVNKYRDGLKARVNQAYTAYDVVFGLNLNEESRKAITIILDDYISLINRKIFNTYSYGGKEDVSITGLSN